MGPSIARAISVKRAADGWQLQREVTVAVMHQTRAVVGARRRRCGRVDINEAASAQRYPVLNLVAAQAHARVVDAGKALDPATWQLVVEQKGDAIRSCGRVRPEKEHTRHRCIAAERKASTYECTSLFRGHGADDVANEPFVIGSRHARDDQQDAVHRRISAVRERVSASTLRLRLAAWTMARVVNGLAHLSRAVPHMKSAKVTSNNPESQPHGIPMCVHTRVQYVGYRSSFSSNHPTYGA